MLELYHHSTSVCAAKVRLVLAEKALEWEGHYVDIIRGEQFNPNYLKVNPKAVVPTLVHDGQVIRESTVINEYLDEVFPNPPLKPADAVARAGMRVWTKMVDEGLHVSCAAITFSLFHRHAVLKMPPAELEIFLQNTRDPSFRERKRVWVLKGLEAPDVRDAIKFHDRMLAEMEAALAKSQWLASDSYSLADVSLTPYVNRLEMLGMAAMWRERPHVADWFERIKARSNFKPAVLDWIPEQMANTMRTNGSAQWKFVDQTLTAA
ncbi:MAG TPA: glutathione S-transferase family protein [Candidatus Binataceae bacterium]|nr:glutathione S-transferase family protein [Candidatus Binataceae bacterium]